MHRVQMICSTPELLAKEIDYLNKVLHLNRYPDWFFRNPTTNMKTKFPARKLLKKPLSQSNTYTDWVRNIEEFSKHQSANNFQGVQHTKHFSNAPLGQNPNTAAPRYNAPVDLPHWKLQFYLNRRIQEMFGKQCHGSQYFIHQHNISTQHNLQSSQGRHITI